MELHNPQEIEAKVQARFRVFLILWAGSFASVVLMATLAMVVGSHGEPNATLSYVLLGAGLMVVPVSFLLKKKLAQQAISKNDLAALQSAQIVALAVCESAAMLGILDRFVTASMTGWFLFGISAVGILINFPSKDQIRAVSYQSK